MKSLMAASLTVALAAASGAAAAKERMLPIPKGSAVGVINLLDAELMHYHAANDSKDSFVKIQAVSWPIRDMLDDSLKEQLEQKGLTILPLVPSEALQHARESCFVDAALTSGLPRGCAAPLIEMASSAGVAYLIVMAPGLNNADHAGSSRNDAVTESMRGWGLLTRQRAGAKDKPALFNEVELLMIGVTPGAVTLRAREWGGVYTAQWQNYSVPADPKRIPEDQLDQLQPAFAAILARQAKGLLDQIRVEP